ncbi:D-isomer specific 2-hydroxyacid dehydrogenase [Chaetomium strumarium]|uniref:D-3-phosphoglycerate dehydrogenase n=1 Tax=Chaetomium strumarium TaxID=1170767 RepID=A0AAJ0GNK1_9PEZI|nr:D-isomer specific 2-hydroxyacid dehydrogenase [Chaetomium strumarium]
MAPAALLASPTTTSTTTQPSAPRILVPEKLSPEGLALLRCTGYQVDTPPAPFSPSDLLSRIPAYHGLIVRSETKVSADVLAAGAKLRVVARAGVGVDNIDVDAATRQGVIVVNSPSGNILAAAEHTVALLLAVARNVGRADAGMKAGKWERAKLVGVEVGRKTLGIVGFGKVGMQVARMAKGLGMEVRVYDPYASAEVATQNGVDLRASLDELVAEVDFLTVHTPLLASTANLVGEKELRRMKRSARVLNVARGGVYNEEALLKALDEGWIAGAALDVFTSEPPAERSVAARLAAHPKVLSTPHLGASTVEAQENVSMDVCTQVVEILRGGLPTAAVNAPLILPEEYRRLQPFVRLIERMGSLYTQHFGGRHSKRVGARRFELVYHGELAGVSNTRPLFAALVKGLVSSISSLGGRDVNIVNAALIAKERGLAIDEKHVRAGGAVPTYASAVTLRSLSTESDEQVIEGYVSGSAVFISKLDRFTANFQPEGTLLVLHNYDEPGKIGNVGMVLGKHGVNINFMQVAALETDAGPALAHVLDGPVGTEAGSVAKEALMILGVAGDVTDAVLKELGRSEGILDVSLTRATLDEGPAAVPRRPPSARMDLSRMSDVEGDSEPAVAGCNHNKRPWSPSRGIRSPATRTRSHSDGGGTPRLSPSPHIAKAARSQSKDDIVIRDKDHEHTFLLPSTPIRVEFPGRGLSLQLARDDSASPAQPSHVRPAPPSPKLEHIYASPTNILPRRSRGLDFSRAATSLHHSTLADQASPDASPTIGSRAMNIPGRRAAEYGPAEQTSTSLWSMMGNQERMQISSSVGSTSHAISDLSSSSDDDDYMDEDMDDAYVTTPQVPKTAMSGGTAAMGAPWPSGSPAVNSLLSFQQRQRQRKPHRRNARRQLGLGFHSPAAPGIMSRSPPSNLTGPNDMSPHARRESISWAANQLHISGNESDDSHSRQQEGLDSPLRPSVVRRAVTRRGNLLPKTKGFARIRAALAEENAPIEAEFRREAEVVRQVRESDMDLEPRHPPPQSVASTALSSPNLGTHDSLEDITDDMMMDDPSVSALGLTGTFKQQAMKNSKGKVFWDTFSETSSTGAASRVTPPPPPFGPARASSSGMSLEDVSMGSPSASSNGGGAAAGQSNNPFFLPGGGTQTTTSSSGNGTPGAVLPSQIGSLINNQGSSAGGPPSAAEITRRINSKRRRDDDLDPVSIKRRAVSPGMSVHNSPVMQSPLQRDTAPWGGTGSGGGSSMSRPGSVGGDSSNGGVGPGRTGAGSGSGAGSENGSSHGGGARVAGGKGRVGLQGMVETNDGITRLSID